MSKKRRNFTAKFKFDIVIELLKGEKDLNSFAFEYEIQQIFLENGRKNFLRMLQ